MKTIGIIGAGLIAISLAKLYLPASKTKDTLTWSLPYVMIAAGGVLIWKARQ